MSQSSNALLPKNRLLRRTLYGLLLAAPVLPLGGCDPRAQYGDCGSWRPYTLNGPDLALHAGESLPLHPSCDDCPKATQHSIDLLMSCEAQEVPPPEGKDWRSYHLVCQYEWCDAHDGRRPEGLQRPGRLEADSVLGAFNAHVAWLEAASVPAFLRLAEELAAHGAPDVLVKAARRSAGDEVRHARVMRTLAERHGGRMPEVDVTPFAPRSLEAMLTENAIEGCVRETYGALSVGWQARTAGDLELRRALRSIARDELRHSELAWAVDDWARDLLSPPERERVLQARRQALRALEQELGQRETPEPLVLQAGLPSRERALELLHGLGSLVARA